MVYTEEVYIGEITEVQFTYLITVINMIDVFRSPVSFYIL